MGWGIQAAYEYRAHCHFKLEGCHSQIRPTTKINLHDFPWLWETFFSSSFSMTFHVFSWTWDPLCVIQYELRLEIYLQEQWERYEHGKLQGCGCSGDSWGRPRHQSSCWNYCSCRWWMWNSFWREKVIDYFFTIPGLVMFYKICFSFILLFLLDHTIFLIILSI